MKVKELQKLLYKLGDDEDVVLLNEGAPLAHTNDVTQAFIVSTPTVAKSLDGVDEERTVSKLVLAYSTRERGEK